MNERSFGQKKLCEGKAYDNFYCYEMKEHWRKIGMDFPRLVFAFCGQHRRFVDRGSKVWWLLGDISRLGRFMSLT